MTPLVSVVCAAYNRGSAIRTTIDSVLAQTMTDFELIVVSDGSTDETDATVLSASRADPRLRLISIEHFGHPSRAMNVGIAAASGEVIAYIDHDDLWTPEHLATVLGALDDGADVVATGSTWIDPQGQVLSVRPAAAMFWHHEIQVLNPVFENSQAAHWARWVDRVGLWRESRHGLEDWDMWLRFADAGARFQTVQRRTVLQTMAISNRHRRLPKAYALELANFPDAPEARRAIDAMRQPDIAAGLVAAGEADSLAWYDRLARTDGFVFGVGFAENEAAALDQLPVAMAAARQADRGWADPVNVRLAPRDGRVALLQDINCMTAEHADRFQVTAQAAQPGLFDEMQRVIAPFHGVVPEMRSARR